MANATTEIKRIRRSTRQDDPNERVIRAPTASPYEQRLQVGDPRKKRKTLPIAAGELLDGRQVLDNLPSRSSASVTSPPPPHAPHGFLALRWILVVDNGEGPDGAHGPEGNIYASVFDSSLRRVSKGVLIGPTNREFDDGDFIEYDPPHVLHYWQNLYDEVILDLWESDSCWLLPEWVCGRENDRLCEAFIQRRGLGFSEDIHRAWDVSKDAAADAVQRARSRIDSGEIPNYVDEIWGTNWDHIPRVVLGLQSIGAKKYEADLRRAGPSGGVGGNPFDTRALSPGQRITGVNVRTTPTRPPTLGHVNGIGINVDGKPFELFYRASGSNIDNGHDLPGGYFISRLEGYYREWIFQLSWTMSNGKSSKTFGPFGVPPARSGGAPFSGARSFIYEAPPGWEIIGFHGRYGSAFGRNWC